MIVKYHEKLMCKRLLSGFLAVMLVVGSVISPLNTQTSYATNRDVRLKYENHAKNDVEIYVQSETVNYNPGDEIQLDLYVQNNSEEVLTGVGFSWSSDESGNRAKYSRRYFYRRKAGVDLFCRKTVEMHQ